MKKGYLRHGEGSMPSQIFISPIVPILAIFNGAELNGYIIINIMSYFD